MSNAEQVSQALAELWDIVKCRCHEAYTGRGLHDPDCECDSTDALQIVTDRIEALTEQLAAARDDAKAAEDELEMQEQEACMMENDYIKLEKERDALEAKLAKTVEALEQIARPKVGPDFDWTEDETNKWRAVWYRKYQDIARATLAEIKSHSDKFATQKGESHE